MPEKPATVAAYAAGASLAAITLFYVFGPTFFIDGDGSLSSNSGKRQVVGLFNPANDCFINSILQALAGLGELRLYLIRELHRRRLDGLDVYATLPSAEDIPKGERPEKILDLQQGLVTQALKEMLDALNERPIYKKTISARIFIQALERSFRRGISRNQQDAQEFLQLVAERLCDEYHAGFKARKRVDPSTSEYNGEGGLAAGSNSRKNSERSTITVTVEDTEASQIPGVAVAPTLPSYYTFPLEGKLESQIECQYCHYQNKPSVSSFVTLTLNVPQQSSTTLGNCFDGLLKTEYIDDFICDNCRLQHAVEYKSKQLNTVGTEKARKRLADEIALIEKAVAEDPEKPPKEVELPDSKLAPRRKIARHMRMTSFPKIAAIHLSRSIYDPGRYSVKNAAKVSFPERLRLGGLLDEKWYKLLAIVCHKGSHNSGHYESFRRNHVYAPFATPDPFSSYAAYSRNNSAAPSISPSPNLKPMSHSPIPLSSVSGLSSSPDISSPSITSTAPSTPPSRNSQSTASFGERKSSSRPTSSTPRSSLQADSSQQPSSQPRSRQSESSSAAMSIFRSPRKAPSSAGDTSKNSSVPSTLKVRRKKKADDKWFRISDEKVKECKTSEVLNKRESVYLLFYEMERE